MIPKPAPSSTDSVMYGQVIVDECHHISAFTFEQVMRQVKAKYIVGLTATPTRKDGHHPIIYMQCGPVRFSMNARTMTESTPFRGFIEPVAFHSTGTVGILFSRRAVRCA